MSDSKTGPLSVADLLATWVAATDPSYNAAFLQAGEGNGLEAYTQGFAQFARVSTAIDVSTQALYIMPWSGQTASPAAGEQKATVQLTFSRSAALNRPLVLGAGQVFYEEQTNDWGEDGAVPILTGRRYTLLSDLVFLPGDSGPFTVTAQAENPGWGYNNPLAGTIKVTVQPGTGFNNTLGTVYINAGAVAPALPPPSIQVFLQAQNVADMFLPDHVGQYVLFTSGSNANIVGRVVTFLPPNSTLNIGSTVQLEDFCTTESFGAVGTFTIGEQVLIKAGATVVGTGIFKVQRLLTNGHTRIGFVLTSGTFATTNTLTGVLSAATATIDFIVDKPAFTPETGTAAWRVLDWVTDLGLTVTNAAQPTGGILGHLDGIAYDRNLFRATGETDNVFRKRVHEIADVVVPNAIKRTLNRVLGGNVAWCFREVGSPSLPGFFYDRKGDVKGDFYDYDTLIFLGSVTSGTFVNPTLATGWHERVELRDANNNLKTGGWFGRIDGGNTFTLIRTKGLGTVGGITYSFAAGDYIIGLNSGAIFTITSQTANTSFPTERFQFYLDYTDFRAMFLIGLPRQDINEFGFSYGVLPAGSGSYRFNAYDSAPYKTFYDGFGWGNSAFYLQVYQAIDKIRAGGVSFYLYLEDGACS